MRTLKALFVLFTVVFLPTQETKAQSDEALLQAMETYAFIKEQMLPPLPSESCRQEMQRVLLTIARMPPTLQRRWSDKELLASLRKQRCVSWHFGVYSKQDSDTYETEKCQLEPIQLSQTDGVWVLKINDLDLCNDRVARLEAFVEDVRKQSQPKFGELDILDLRDERGGEQDAELYLLGELFSPGEGGFSGKRTRRVGEAFEILTFETKKRGLLGCPALILANKDTASAAEILADVILGGCPPTKVIGQQTYGKAVGAYTMEIGDFAVWGITTTGYSSPGGRLKDGFGITPDIVTKPGEEMAAALKYLKEHPRTATSQ